MRHAYFDSSAIVKLSYVERESQALLDYLTDGDRVMSTSVISDVEVKRALRRLPVVEDADGVRGFYLLELSSDIRKSAGGLGSPALRSFDAIHLASALTLGGDLDFITYDDRLAAAAREAGLRVVQPGR